MDKYTIKEEPINKGMECETAWYIVMYYNQEICRCLIYAYAERICDLLNERNMAP